MRLPSVASRCHGWLGCAAGSLLVGVGREQLQYYTQIERLTRVTPIRHPIVLLQVVHIVALPVR